MEKGAVSSNLPIDADLERAWDSGAAIKRIKDWASDGDGNIDFGKYRKAFFYEDGDGTKQSDFKLPFADISGDSLKAVWKGVAAAMAAIMGSRGGVDMPDADRKSVYGEIAKYYKKFDKEAPELKTASSDEIVDKGAVAEELAADEAQDAKMGMLEDFWEVIYAFCDVFYDEETSPDQFSTLLNEAIGILQQVADGKYQDADDNENEPIGAALANGVDKEQLENFIQGYIATRPKKNLELDPEVGVIYKTEDGQSVYGVDATYDVKQKIAIASTDVMDRQGERVSQEGWDLKNFKKNPLLLWGHDHSKIAVGNAKNIHIERTGGKPQLVFTPVFHDKTDDARALGALYDEGWMNSFSVGFIPKDMDGATSTYLKQELLEISACNVPANPEATMMAMKTLKKAGIPEKTMADLGLKTQLDDQEGPEVLDTPENTPETISNEPPVKAQEPSAAPQEPSNVRAEQSLIKVIAKASDLILLGEKTGQEQDERVKLQKVIKRAAEILSTSQRRKIEDGKTR